MLRFLSTYLPSLVEKSSPSKCSNMGFLTLLPVLPCALLFSGLYPFLITLSRTFTSSCIHIDIFLGVDWHVGQGGFLGALKSMPMNSKPHSVHIHLSKVFAILIASKIKYGEEPAITC